MKVLDATFLIDYLAGVDETKAYLEDHGNETFVAPVPAYAEAVVGAGNAPDGDVPSVHAGLSWVEVHRVDQNTAELAGEVAKEIGASGLNLSGMDGLIAATAVDLGAPLVSNDSDLAHPETRRVVDVETYRE